MTGPYCAAFPVHSVGHAVASIAVATNTLLLGRQETFRSLGGAEYKKNAPPPPPQAVLFAMVLADIAIEGQPDDVHT